MWAYRPGAGGRPVWLALGMGWLAQAVAIVLDALVLGGAESGAFKAGSSPDPLLEALLVAWPRLTQEQRVRIVSSAMASPTTRARRPRGDT